MQRPALVVILQFRYDLVDYFNIIRILKTVYHNKRMGIRLSEEVFRLVYLVGRIYESPLS